MKKQRKRIGLDLERVRVLAHDLDQVRGGAPVCTTNHGTLGNQSGPANSCIRTCVSKAQ